MISVACVALRAQAGDDVQLYRNQVGCYPQQEKVVVVEGMNPSKKMRIITPDGEVVKAKSVRKAVSPLSGKTRYVVDLGDLSATGDYRVSLGTASCMLHVSKQPYHDIATSALRLFYLIRSGIPIEQGGVYNRPLGHADTLCWYTTRPPRHCVPQVLSSVLPMAGTMPAIIISMW